MKNINLKDNNKSDYLGKKWFAPVDQDDEFLLSPFKVKKIILLFIN